MLDDAGSFLSQLKDIVQKKNSPPESAESIEIRVASGKRDCRYRLYSYRRAKLIIGELRKNKYFLRKD